MRRSKIYVLHEYGEKSHYQALQTLLKEHGIALEFFKFACIKGSLKALFRRDWKKLKEEMRSCLFLLRLLFTKGEKIVLGAAPFDYRLLAVRRVLLGHRVYYHTSWPYWDEVFYPKKRYVNRFVKREWSDFLNDQVEAIFCVTQQAKTNIERYLEREKEVFVVYHAYDEKIFFNRNLQREITFMYAGRLVEQKGIKELLEIFSKREESLLIVGEGDLKEKVQQYAQKYANITYLPRQPKKELAQLYNKSRYFLLNSQKRSFWEELFGMVLIESMACGSIPIATEHIGPKEILQNGRYGILYKEGELEAVLKRLPKENRAFLVTQRAQEFRLENIKRRWQRVLDE